ncbi:zinc finger protein 561-like [Tigriopus californicus]|nr:zinc finger protein 561-like [Tigriopus californicus]
MHLKIELNTTWLAEEEINSSVCLKCNVCDTIEVFDKSSDNDEIEEDGEVEPEEEQDEQPNESEIEPISTDIEELPSSVRQGSDVDDGFEPLDDSVADPDHVEDIELEEEEEEELELEEPVEPVSKARSTRQILGEVQRNTKNESLANLERSSLPDAKNMAIKSCHCCSKKFRNSRDLKNHLCLHFKVELFRDYAINKEECKLCGFKDKQVMRLAGHIGYKHDKLKEYVSETDQPEVHLKARSLDKNIQTKLLVDDEYGRALLRKELAEIDLLEKPCNLCGKLHQTKHRRMKHIANHFGSFLLKHFPRLKGNECTICGKDLARGGSVYYHLGFVHKGLAHVAESPVPTMPTIARKSRRQQKI